ncbi:MAG TPA: hypothetical protein VNA29_01435 [Sphingomicrobium sp.]|nr:hypothetical protein [Sphingomicrobium sp.]
MRRTMLRVALLSCAALAVSPALAVHSWGKYHWGRTSNPLNLRVVDAVTSQWDGALNTAISDWQIPNFLQLTEEPDSPYNAKKCTAITGKVLVCNAAYGQRGWLGIATIWASGDHITKATTKLNDSYHSYPPYNTSAWRALVMCQEIGHDFGLGHQDENHSNANLNTCMDYTNSPESNQHPNEHDYDMLKSIYAHTDSVNTSATQTTDFGLRILGQAPVAPPGLNEEAGDSPAEWGRAIGTDGHGRPNLYVMDLGGGRKKITHVFWAIGEGPNGKHRDAH